jgi:hypothetical protein
MGTKLRLTNETSDNLVVQVELAGITALVLPSSEIVIDTDFTNAEELHLELRSDRVVVWGGVAAEVVGSTRPAP